MKEGCIARVWLLGSTSIALTDLLTYFVVDCDTMSPSRTSNAGESVMHHRKTAQLFNTTYREASKSYIRA